MRLIDADKLKEAIRKKVLSRENLTLYVIYAVLEEIIDEQPEAYNINDVVEELRKEIKPIVGLYTSETPLSEQASYKMKHNMAIKRAIEIVERGG